MQKTRRSGNENNFLRVWREKKKYSEILICTCFGTFWTNCEQSIVQWNIFNANCQPKKTYRDIYCIWTIFWSKNHYCKLFEAPFIGVRYLFHFPSSTKMTFIWICLLFKLNFCYFSSVSTVNTMWVFIFGNIFLNVTLFFFCTIWAVFRIRIHSKNENDFLCVF